MISIALKSIVSRLILNKFVQHICIYFLLSISCSSWAQSKVDLLTAEPVLAYKISHKTLAENDSLKIEVYSDGHALLHYPSYMKKSGDYKVQLSQGDFQRLINTLDTPGIRSFNNKALGLQKKVQDKTNGLITLVSDISYSSFEVSRSDEHGNNKTKQQIICPHLQYDAKQHPNIGAIKKLAEVELFLTNLINQSDIQELADE